jgi:UDP-N-acetylmuramoyl-tripeptide--D-alanyl-D-alanine ligase
MELARARGGALVLNDTYNANPLSMAAALRALAGLPATRRIAVVGTMAELGDVAASEHRAIAAMAGELGITVIAVDEPRYGVVSADDLEHALELLGPIDDGDAVLVKGSRVVGLEQLAARLLT